MNTRPGVGSSYYRAPLLATPYMMYMTLSFISPWDMDYLFFSPFLRTMMRPFFFLSFFCMDLTSPSFIHFSLMSMGFFYIYMAHILRNDE